MENTYTWRLRWSAAEVRHPSWWQTQVEVASEKEKEKKEETHAPVLCFSFLVERLKWIKELESHLGDKPWDPYQVTELIANGSDVFNWLIPVEKTQDAPITHTAKNLDTQGTYGCQFFQHIVFIAMQTLGQAVTLPSCFTGVYFVGYCKMQNVQILCRWSALLLTQKHTGATSWWLNWQFN